MAIPEKVKAGIKLVAPGTWPTESADELSAVAALLPVEASIDLHPETGRTPDESLRSLLSRTYNSYEGMQHAAGSFSGPAYPNLFGALLKSLFGSDTVTGMSAGGKGTSTTLTGAVAMDGGVPTDETTAANNGTANDMTLLPAIPAENDAYYFGCDTKFAHVRVNIGTQGIGTWTITWEYYNGTSWAALSGVTDGTTGFTAATGNRDVYFQAPSNWATVAVGGITTYWVRARVSAYTGITTQPLGTQAWVFTIPVWEHRFVPSATPHPFTVVVHDPFSTADQVRAYGCMLSSLGLTINAAEGVATYSADLLGVNFSDSDDQTISAKQSGLDGTEFYCPVKPFKGYLAKAEIGSLVEGTDFRLVSAEITVERELTLFTRFGSAQNPNSYVYRAPKVTFSMVTEFLSYDAYKYALDFEDYKGAVVLQLCSNTTSVTSAEASTTFSDLNVSGNLDSNRALLYIRMPNVDFGEGPVKLDHAAAPLTLEWNCEALPDSSGYLFKDRANSLEGLILVNGTESYDSVSDAAHVGWT